ncbi:hypothetical protein [Pedobacter jeongneungensis]|uniref:hypothetical protein n=1 Tax=Pedobacter jeongneungensis TaxID=947309 RepID=UPI0004689729|nr:hypothetical protein [Pedobacter jeongneungensis]
MEVPHFENLVTYEDYTSALRIVERYHDQIRVMVKYSSDLQQKKLSGIDLAGGRCFFDIIKDRVSLRTYNAIYKHIEIEILRSRILLFSPRDFTVDHFLTLFPDETELGKIYNLSSKGSKEVYDTLRKLNIEID